MNISDLKERTILALVANRDRYDSDAQQARVLEINPAQLSRINKGDYKALGDQSWIRLARRLSVSLNPAIEWKTARTPVYDMISQQLTVCQEQSISALLCDIADIGKTYTAKSYVKSHPNAVYIDCSQYKTKNKLIRKIAQEYGVTNTGKYNDVYEDLVYYLTQLVNPLVILDEAGDLAYTAFLELKALWNATEYACGWYMMGADGLRKKIDRNINHKKVGYTEIFSRFGNRYQKVSPNAGEQLKEWKQAQTALVAKANSKTVDVRKIYAKTQGSLRRIYIELQKERRSA